MDWYIGARHTGVGIFGLIYSTNVYKRYTMN